MKRFFAGLMVFVLCACALMQLASPVPMIWFAFTLFAAIICMLCAWGCWYRKLAFLWLLLSAVALGWVWQGSVWLLTNFSHWDSVTFFSSKSPFLQMRHALILWIMMISLSVILIRVDRSDKTDETKEYEDRQDEPQLRQEPKI